ncbi:MAG: AraC family transcriptional regulator, partial [Nitrosomonas sp. PRO5]|nr:AraC family transcriptional regulator [Nitrosomonas sp. PRO5]
MDQDWIFDEIDVIAEPFAFCELGPQDKLFLPREQKATLHYVLSGVGEIQLPDHPPISIAAGDVVLIPAIMKHSLHGEKGGTVLLPTCKPAILGLEHHIGGGATSDRLQILCGRVSIGLRGAMSVIDLLQKPIVAPANKASIQ